MSRRAMPWFKLYASLLDEEEFWSMPLEERAVYLDLLMLAAKSKPRGTFNVADLDRLARRVADGRRDVLDATLHYCTKEWLTRDGTPTITISGNRGYFTRWGELQQPPSSNTSDSADEPEPNPEEIRSENGEINSGFVPVLPTSRRKKGEGRSKRVEEREKTVDAETEKPPDPAADPPPDVDEVLRILRMVEGRDVQDSAAVRERISRAADEEPDIDPVKVVLDYVIWQNNQPKAKRHKDLVRGFCSQMTMRASQPGQKYHRRDPTDDAGFSSGAWQAPDIAEMPPCNTELWRELRIAVLERLQGNYPLYFSGVADQMRGDVLVLTFPDEYEQGWALHYADTVTHCAADCGYPGLAIEYAVLGQDARAAG